MSMTATCDGCGKQALARLLPRRVWQAPDYWFTKNGKIACSTQCVGAARGEPLTPAEAEKLTRNYPASAIARMAG